MIDVEFETPNQVDRLASFAAERIQEAKSRVAGHLRIWCMAFETLQVIF